MSKKELVALVENIMNPEIEDKTLSAYRVRFFT